MDAPEGFERRRRAPVRPGKRRTSNDRLTSRRGFLARLRDERGRLPISRLTMTIFLTNLFGLTILMAGSMRLNHYRDGLIEAKLEGVRAQAQVVAAIMATVAAEDADCDIIAAGEYAAPCDVILNEDRVNTIFTRVWPSFEGRVRIFSTPVNYDGTPIEDASSLLLQDKTLRADNFVVSEAPAIEGEGKAPSISEVTRNLRRGFVDIFIDPGFRSNARAITLEDELTRAFLASSAEDYPSASSVRYNEEGQIVASVSVPIRKVQAVYGVVTAEIGGIEELVAQARAALLGFFWVAAIVALIMSILLTTTIAGPIRKLAAAADRVREGVRGSGKMRIPEFPRRRDEIGELSDSLRQMTQELYNRIETIDHFAADVSHELKNPLTSIRSAIETLDVARTDEQRARLLAVINNDVARMDRLITDISNASRLDAELAREAREAVDIARLLRDITELYGTTRKEHSAAVRLLGRMGKQPLYVFGSPSTLGQVFRNLIDNALSFSPPDGTVRVTLSVSKTDDGPVVHVSVADDGPGIPEDTLNRIFERFYTKRPAGTSFGNNSGLGLAICRQIAESHGGRIWAENRMNADRSQRIGAVFHVTLPLRRQT
ncbi:sensor histidine kinase [Parvularcula sp. LCG005]|uniref:sensor histidine kinase n=1 Tax=Parvularcula sp. LCG005 TaxID=3078805 RepID=UPI0029436775|nr:sensor histidine kinase [Parvularcula sp. LCG005]WOI53174.1 sensor histidine kinase [Parvularcula sp. LCG005]